MYNVVVVSVDSSVVDMVLLHMSSGVDTSRSDTLTAW